MIDYSKLYEDYLYDCYIANQRLTAEDWHYYGREEHHIEVPRRDKGLLTPLNSQNLTRYQHWIAGVLQSEVLGRKCFAFVPAGTLPPHLELLRSKWAALHADVLNASLTPEERSARARTVWENRTPDERSVSARKAQATRTPEERSAIARARQETRTPEERSASISKGWASLTPEERTARALRGHDTRRRNQQGG